MVICAYNRGKLIGEALESLANQTAPKRHFEIIIVDNNSTDNTPSVCKNFIKKHPDLDAKYVVETNQGLSFGRNRGIAEAKYEIISYIDDDAYAKPDFIELIFNYFNKHPNTAGIGGKVTPRYETAEPVWMNKYLYGLVAKADLGNKTRKFKNKEYPVGCNMTYRKDILLQAGGFNNNLRWRADDKYINSKVKEITTEIVYLPELEVEHSIDDYRTSDENFKKICLEFGIGERGRIYEEGTLAFFKKIAEYLFKLAGSFVLLLLFYAKGEFAKGNYTFNYRWLALRGLLLPVKKLVA